MNVEKAKPEEYATTEKEFYESIPNLHTRKEYRNGLQRFSAWFKHNPDEILQMRKEDLSARAMLALLITSLFSLTFIVQPAEAETIVVPVQYSTIQAAVDAATTRDTILALNGTYHESLRINKSLNVVGENPSTTIVDGSISIGSDNVEVSGFTILGGAERSVGVEIGRIPQSVSVSNCTIKNNIISSQYGERWGVVLWGSSTNNSIIGNTILGNSRGIWIESSDNNTIADNLISGNWDFGILLLFGSSYNKIANNTISNHEVAGIVIITGASGLSSAEIVASTDDEYTGNIIVDNDMFNNEQNIYVESYYSNTRIVGNRITNGGRGIFIYRSFWSHDYPCNATVTGNWIANCKEGIHIKADFNNVTGNTAMNCTTFGISLDDAYATNNTVYHNNFINNAQQVNEKGANTTWDDGYPSGGNYWSDYNGTDTDFDGIDDTPYIIDENNRDNYPLMYPRPFMIGDINCDAEVDIYDVTAICVAYDSKPGDPNWYPPADIAPPYGIIDIYDVTAVCINYGKKWPH